MDELHADFKQLEVDVHAANQASSRARKDRIEGFKRALRDILQAADRAEKPAKLPFQAASPTKFPDSLLRVIVRELREFTNKACSSLLRARTFSGL